MIKHLVRFRVMVVHARVSAIYVRVRVVDVGGLGIGI